jgi:hypothetical protein
LNALSLTFSIANSVDHGTKLLSIVGVFSEVGDGVAVGVGFFTATPLFHTNFLPDLMQV